VYFAYQCSRVKQWLMAIFNVGLPAISNLSMCSCSVVVKLTGVSDCCKLTMTEKYYFWASLIDFVLRNDISCMTQAEWSLWSS